MCTDPTARSPRIAMAAPERCPTSGISGTSCAKGVRGGIEHEENLRRRSEASSATSSRWPTSLSSTACGRGVEVRSISPRSCCRSCSCCGGRRGGSAGIGRTRSLYAQRSATEPRRAPVPPYCRPPHPGQVRAEVATTRRQDRHLVVFGFIAYPIAITAPTAPKQTRSVNGSMFLLLRGVIRGRRPCVGGNHA